MDGINNEHTTYSLSTSSSNDIMGSDLYTITVCIARPRCRCIAHV